MIDASGGNGDAWPLLVGEIHTGLLQSSTPLPLTFCQQVLALLRGERACVFERPIAYAVSPDVFTGVDCRLATVSGAKARGVGTVASHAAITGGHAVQGSTHARLIRGEGNRRPWPHYLAMPGRVEVIGRAKPPDLAGGFAGAGSRATTLDLGAVTGRLVHGVQTSPKLDRRPPFRTARTKLRWAAMPGDADTVRFSVESGQLRTVLLTCTAGSMPTVVEFCEDLALHDWLLTTLLHLLDLSRIGVAPGPEVVRRLRPAVDHLLHLWMPAARVDRSGATLWDSLDDRPHLSRQWHASVDRIRDQMALSTIAVLGADAR